MSRKSRMLIAVTILAFSSLALAGGLPGNTYW